MCAQLPAVARSLACSYTQIIAQLLEVTRSYAQLGEQTHPDGHAVWCAVTPRWARSYALMATQLRAVTLTWARNYA